MHGDALVNFLFIYVIIFSEATDVMVLSQPGWRQSKRMQYLVCCLPID